MKGFMWSAMREMITAAEHRRGRTLQLIDVLDAGCGTTLYGTGRLGEHLLRSIRIPEANGAAAEAEEQAQFEADAAAVRRETAKYLHGDDEGDGLISKFAEVVKDAREKHELAEKARTEGPDDEEVDAKPAREALISSEIPSVADPCGSYAYTLQLIRAMQQGVEPVIPCLGFSRLCYEVSQNFKTDLSIAPEAICAINSVVEHYLVRLLEDAHLAAIHRGRLMVLPKDMQLSRRIRAGGYVR